MIPKTSATIVVVATLAGCQPTVQEIDVDVVVPEDADDLEAANNAAMVLEPDGASYSAEADGLDFELSVQLDPDDELRTLALYLARDETLLAWGRTAAFNFAAAAAGIAVFLGEPGALSTFPLALDLPDDMVLAAAAPGRGVVMLSSNGATSYLDGFTLDTEAADPLSDPPPADDGVLVGDAAGGVMRVAWASGLRVHRFDPGEDAWIDVEHSGAAAIGERPGAAWAVDGAATVLSLYGGGTNVDVVAIDLVVRDDDSLLAGVVDGLTLDAPRLGASAMWITRDDGDDAEDVVLFGSADARRSALYLVQAATPLGPVGMWSEGRCVQLERGTDGEDVRVLCGGGLREGTPTGDALVLTLDASGSATIEERPALLDPPIASPRWFVDDVAVYAQGDAMLLPLDRETLALGDPRSALRARGGQLVPLEGGATLVVGGADSAGAPTTRIQVFTPALPEN